MTNIRIEETWDGLCTVFIGHQVVVAGLSRTEADSLVEVYRRRAEGRRDA
jgi:hypothetical protein